MSVIKQLQALRLNAEEGKHPGNSKERSWGQALKDALGRLADALLPRPPILVPVPVRDDRPRRKYNR